MCINIPLNEAFYVVADRHGTFDTFDTLEDARTFANHLVEGYKDGTRSANHPMPVITECRNIEKV